MTDQITYKLIDESVGSIIKDILLKQYKSYEKINNNETRIIIDLYIVYIDIKNNLNLIIDRLVDKFKIINRDSMFKLLVNHIYDDETRKQILKINKLIINKNLKSVEEYKKANVDYLYNEIFQIIFSDQVIDYLKYSSDSWLIYVYYTKTLFRNWKIILVFVIVLLVFYLTIKKLKLCNI
jgi:hypothetical protein